MALLLSTLHIRNNGHCESFLFVFQSFTALIVLLVAAAIFVKVHTKVTSGGKEGKLSFSVMLSE